MRLTRYVIGDFVVLKSGGPRMTVVDHTRDEITVCYRQANGVEREWSLPMVCVRTWKASHD